MASYTIGCITEFKPDNEKIEAYLECVQFFFKVNNINKEKQVPVLLTMIGSSNYALLSNLVSPEKPIKRTRHLCNLLKCFAAILILSC